MLKLTEIGIRVNVFKVFGEMTKETNMHVRCLSKCQDELGMWTIQCEYPTHNPNMWHDPNAWIKLNEATETKIKEWYAWI